MTESGSKSPGEHTSTDLGEDLLEDRPTGSDVFRGPVITDDGAVSPPLPATGIDDQLQSASILLNEGFTEDAKRLLRKILIADPHSVVARKKLDEIHETELRQIFSDSPAPRAYGRITKVEPISEPEKVLRQLDEELGLGLAASAVTEADRRAWSSSIDHALDGATPRDRIDVGIAFLEMGLPWMAVNHFRVARGHEEWALPATALLARALIAAGEPFEATICLQTSLTDSELPRSEKSELLYLMANACEALGQHETAIKWYRQTLSVDRYYRDTLERLRKLEKPKAR